MLKLRYKPNIHVLTSNLISEVTGKISHADKAKMIKLKLRSFKSSEHINEKGDGPYRSFDY